MSRTWKPTSEDWDPLGLSRSLQWKSTIRSGSRMIDLGPWANAFQTWEVYCGAQSDIKSEGRTWILKLLDTRSCAVSRVERSLCRAMLCDALKGSIQRTGFLCFHLMQEGWWKIWWTGAGWCVGTQACHGSPLRSAAINPCTAWTVLSEWRSVDRAPGWNLSVGDVTRRPKPQTQEAKDEYNPIAWSGNRGRDGAHNRTPSPAHPPIPSIGGSWHPPTDRHGENEQKTFLLWWLRIVHVLSRMRGRCQRPFHLLEFF